MRIVVAGVLLLLSAARGEPGASSRTENAFAAPEVVILHGGSLRERVVIADWRENLRLMGGLIPQRSITDSALERRPYVDVAMFWGTHWRDYSDTPEKLRLLQPSQANQFGRLYPADGGAPAVFVFRFGMAAGLPQMPYRSVGAEAIDVLVRHGVKWPMRQALRASHQSRLGPE